MQPRDKGKQMNVKKIKSVQLVHKCGCRSGMIIQAKLARKAIEHASRTRCLNCFNTKSLTPEVFFQVGDRVKVAAGGFGMSKHIPHFDCTITRILENEDRVLVRTNRDYFFSGHGYEELVDIEYVSLAQ
jgi:hypothetical protein